MFGLATRQLRRAAAAALIAGVLASPVSIAQAQQLIVTCPTGYYLANGVCLPYSWAGTLERNDVVLGSRF